MRDIYDLVQDEIFNKININIEVINASILTNGVQIVSFCSNKWLRVGQFLTDSNNKQWKIILIDSNGNVSIKKPQGATGVKSLDVLKVISPKFLFGTHISANNEYTLKQRKTNDLLPLIWLVENIREKEYGRDSSIERDSNLRFFFLDDIDPKNQLNEDFRKNAVTPMLALKDEFLNVIQNNSIFVPYTSVDIRTITRFGNEKESGAFENILNDNLSGVELNITLNVYRNNKCNC
jgi:hypothetical protein